MKAKKTTYLLAALLSCLLLCTTAFAAGGLTVRLESDESQALSGMQAALCQVVDRGALTEDFTACGFTAAQLKQEYGAERAQALYDYLIAQGLDAQIQSADSRGEVRFTGLQQGLYLVFAPQGQAHTFLPYLVWLSGDGETVSEPKVEEAGNKPIRVTVVWNDGNDADGLRPAAVEVRLLRDGRAVRKVTLSAANGWKHTFTGLPNNGTYTVEQLPVSGYTTTYSGNAEDGFVITNRRVPVSDVEHIEIAVQKVWQDNDNVDGARPRSVTVQLIENGTVIRTAVLSVDNDWYTVFSGLLAENTYSVKEIPVTGYTVAYNGNMLSGFRITNTREGLPDGPEEPDEPDIPTPPGPNPDVSVPDTPDPPTPDVPEPDVPTIPQTGAYTWPMYLLFAAGTALVLLGAADLYRGRRKS